MDRVRVAVTLVEARAKAPTIVIATTMPATKCEMTLVRGWACGDRCA